MLVLAGIELHFFIVTDMGPCFVFVLKTVLIIQDVLGIADQCLPRRPFLLLTPPARGLGVHKKLGGDTAKTGDSS